MIDDTTKPALAIMQPDWSDICPANVDALMTLRAGGVSSGPFGDKDGIGGFNVGLYTGDVPVCVNMNRQLAAQLVPADPKWLKQVHGTKVVDAETAMPEEQADASTAVTPNTVCVVQVADCLPVLIAEKEGKAVAAVHCGWRSNPEAQFIAWFGPRIGDDDFETGAEVLDAMKQSISAAEVAFREKENGHYLCSLTTLARMALLQVGVQDVVEARHSTYSNPELFYSYRRDGKTGRHAAMIWIKA